MTDLVLSAPDTNGKSYQLDLDNLEQVFAYNGSNQLITITVVYAGITFVQTFTRDGSGNVTDVSRFVPQ